MELPVLVMAQYNRKSQEGASKRGGMQFIGLSSSIEQVADQAYSFWATEEMRYQNNMGVELMKFRRGPSQMWLLDWRLPRPYSNSASSGHWIRLMYRSVSVGQKIDNPWKTYRTLLRMVSAADILDHYHAENVSLQGDELIHSCIIDKVHPHHSNGDQTPSAAFNREKMLYKLLVLYQGWRRCVVADPGDGGL